MRAILATLAILLAALTAPAAVTSINTGTTANDGTGDTLREAFRKHNTNVLYLDAVKLDKTNGVAYGLILRGSTNVFQHTNGAVAGYVLYTDGTNAYWAAAPAGGGGGGFGNVNLTQFATNGGILVIPGFATVTNLQSYSPLLYGTPALQANATLFLSDASRLVISNDTKGFFRRRAVYMDSNQELAPADGGTGRGNVSDSDLFALEGLSSKLPSPNRITNSLLWPIKDESGKGTNLSLWGTGISGNRPLYVDSANKVQTLAVAPSELNTLIGITSDVQPQLDGKVDENSGVATNLAGFGVWNVSALVTTNHTNSGSMRIAGMTTTGPISDTAVTTHSLGALTLNNLVANELLKGDSSSKVVSAGVKVATSLSGFSDGQVLTYRSAHGTLTNETPSGVGEVNSGVNLGTGQQLFAGKSGLNLQFNTLSNSDASISLSSNGNVVSISVAASSIGTAKLTNGGVTFAKMQDITTDRLLGRDTAGTGSPEEISLTGGLGFTGSQQIGINAQGVDTSKLTNASQSKVVLGRNSAGAGSYGETTLQQLLDWSGGSAQGSILYRDANNWTNLAPGTSGQLLSSGGAGANPSWSTVSASPGGSPWTPQIANAAGTGLAGMTNDFFNVTNNTLTLSNFTASGAVVLTPRALTVSGTNLIADGSLGTIFAGTLVGAANMVTNLIFTNISAGQTMTIDVYPTNGLTVNLLVPGGSSPPANWYTDGAAISLQTNGWNRISIRNTGSGTNIWIGTPTYALVWTNAGTTTVTDYVARVIIVPIGTGGSGSSNMVVASVGNLDLTNQIKFRSSQLTGSAASQQIDFSGPTRYVITNQLNQSETLWLTNMADGLTATVVVPANTLGTNFDITVSVAAGGTATTNINWYAPTNGSVSFTAQSNAVYYLSFVCESTPTRTNINATWTTTAPNPIRGAIQLLSGGNSASNAVVGGKLYQNFTATAVPTSNGTPANLASWTNGAHLLTNSGDALKAVWWGTMPSAQANTNQFQIIYGSQTILDTGMQTASNCVYRAEVEITRTGNTAQHANARLQWGPGNGAPWAYTNVDLELTQTNGIATFLSLASTSRRQGSHTNTMMQVYYEPASR